MKYYIKAVYSFLIFKNFDCVNLTKKEILILIAKRRYRLHWLDNRNIER